jgi:hypothetical protein
MLGLTVGWFCVVVGNVGVLTLVPGLDRVKFFGLISVHIL